ncbi:hypothetical protein GJAV_G00039750, partial [Gymnothorax javanicus]
GCAKRYTDPSSLRKHVKAHSSRELQTRKKLRSGSEVDQEALSDCLTIQPIHHGGSPLNAGGGVMDHSPGPAQDMYSSMFQTSQPSHSHSVTGPTPSAATMGLPSPNSIVPLLPPLEDTCRFTSMPPHPNAPGLPALCSPQPLDSCVAPPSTSAPLGQSSLSATANRIHPQGLGPVVQAGCPLPYSVPAASAKPRPSCHMKRLSNEDGLPPIAANQHGLDVFYSAVNGITVCDLQGEYRDFLGDLTQGVTDESSFLQVTALDRCPSQLSSIYTEG